MSTSTDSDGDDFSHTANPRPASAHLGLEALASLLEASLDGIVVVDEDRRYIYANPAACGVLGYQLHQLIGQDFLVNFPTRVHHDMVQRFNANMAGQPGRWSAVIRRPDGNEREIEYANMRMNIAGRRCAASIFRDVTEVRRLTRGHEEMARVASSVAFAGSLEMTLDALASSVVRATGTVACMVMLFEEEPRWFRFAGSHGVSEAFVVGIEKVLREAITSSRQLGLSSELAGRIIAAVHARAAPGPEDLARPPILVRNAPGTMLADSAYAAVHHLLPDVEWDTVSIVRMAYQNRLLGSLVGFYPKEHDPDEAGIALFTAIADQAAVAVENARLLVAAQEKAALEERQRLARELHDSVSQALYGIALGARTARTLLDQDPTKAGQPLDYVQSLADAALIEMRALIFELRPESLEREGLVVALGRQVAAMRARHGIEVQADLGDEPEQSLEVKQSLYRIAQEALHNTLKHARASRIDLRLATNAGEVVLEVADNGVGFDPDASFPGHLGLRSMRERVTGLGGSLKVDSSPTGGTRISARIPNRVPG